MLLAISPRNRAQLQGIVERWTLEAMLASLQIFSECRARMRGSVHGRLLVEIALVRVARLEELTSLSSLVERLGALESSPPPRRPEPPTVRTKPSMVQAPPAGEAIPGRAEPRPSASRAVGSVDRVDPKPVVIAPETIQPRPRVLTDDGTAAGDGLAGGPPADVHD